MLYFVFFYVILMNELLHDFLAKYIIATALLLKMPSVKSLCPTSSRHPSVSRDNGKHPCKEVILKSSQHFLCD